LHRVAPFRGLFFWRNGMTGWRSEVRTCMCGERFKAKREAQAYCSKRCAKVATQRRKRSGDRTADHIPVPRSGGTPFSDSPTASEWAICRVCPVCRLWRMLPRDALPRHLFCMAVRKTRRTLPALAEAA
jgi:hypothetical protein